MARRHLATAPIALCEVQGYAYAAAMVGAELLDAFGLTGGDDHPLSIRLADGVLSVQ